MKHKNWAILALIISGLLLTVLFVFTSPRDVGLVGILAVIVAIFILFNSSIYLIMSAFTKSDNTNSRRQVLISSALAFMPVLLIILNSLNTLNVISLVLIVLFEVVMIFLIINRT